MLDKNHSVDTPRAKNTPKSNASSIGVPATVTQNRRRAEDVDEGFSRDGSLLAKLTPTSCAPDGEHLLNSPLVVANSGSSRHSNNIFEKESHSENGLGSNYEKFFQMKKKSAADKPAKPKAAEITVPETPEFGKVRTPDKMRISRLKLAGPLLPAKSTKPLTIPVEFSFADRPTTNRRHSLEPDQIKEQSINVKTEKRLTVPHSPKLMTKIRRTADDAAAVEAKVSTSSISSSRSADDARPRLTVPVTPKLSTYQRFSVKHQSQGSAEAEPPKTKPSLPTSTSTFKTTKIASIASGPRQLTIPQSPNITKARPKGPINNEETKSAPSQLKTMAFAKPNPPKFAGDRIAEEKRRRFQEQLQKEREQLEKAREFHARPAPHFAPKVNSEDHSVMTLLIHSFYYYYLYD